MMEGGKRVILCVDDDADIVASLRVVLESAGYEVVSAPTAAEGLRAYLARRPDLILLDLMMEEIDSGLRLARELKDRGNTAPLFFLSSTGDYLHGTADTSEVGASGVLQKPVEPRMLLSLVGTALATPALRS
jgi:DNA-binding response OmpR family regulator